MWKASLTSSTSVRPRPRAQSATAFIVSSVSRPFASTTTAESGTP